MSANLAIGLIWLIELMNILAMSLVVVAEMKPKDPRKELKREIDDAVASRHLPRGEYTFHVRGRPYSIRVYNDYGGWTDDWDAVDSPFGHGATAMNQPLRRMPRGMTGDDLRRAIKGNDR